MTEPAPLDRVQWFDGRHKSTPGDIVLTIQRRGIASLSVSAFEAMGKPEYIRLGFVPDNETIVIAPATESDPNRYPLRVIGSKANARAVTMIRFLESIGYPLGEVRRYAGKSDGGYLFFGVAKDMKDANKQRPLI